MVKAIIEFGSLFDEVMETYIERPALARALAPFADAEGEDFADLLRGYALYKAKLSKLMPEGGKYVIIGSNAYYKNRHGETTALAKAVLRTDGNSVEITIKVNDEEVGLELLSDLHEVINRPMSVSEFIDFLYYVGLSKFRGKAYFNMDTIIPKVEETFPAFNEKLYIQEKIDLLEDATANCAGDESIPVLGTKVINQLIERDLVSKFRKKADNDSYITYRQKNVYREGKRIKFITYSWEPKTAFGIHEVGTSMSPMNLRDMILEEE